jgi:hypothetical protein
MSTLDSFFGDGNAIKPTEVTPELQTVIEVWQAAIAQRRIGFLPRSHAGRLYWYGFAPTARDRRELLDLLDSWIGPTYSDLARCRGDLDLQDPFDAALHGLPTPPLRFEVLPRTQPAATYSRDKVRSALQVMSRMIASRPSSEFDAPRTTVEVLDDLGHAISAQDRRVALACLRELEATADLDQTNLAFMRLRVYAGLQDWAAILSDQDLQHILAMRRPLGVTRVIQRAVYANDFATADHEGRDSDLLAAVHDLPQQFLALATGAVTHRRSDVVVEFLLALQAANPSTALARLIGEADLIEEGLAARLRALLPAGEPAPVEPEPPVVEPVETPVPEPETTLESAPTQEREPETPLQQAARLVTDGKLQAALDHGLTLAPSPDVADLLLFCARELAEAEAVAAVTAYLADHRLREVLAAGDVRQRDGLAWLDECNRPERTLGWLGWFESLADEVPLDIDPEAIADWEPLNRTEVFGLLFDCSETILGRFGERGGQFMAAHRDLFIADGAAELSERVLAGLAIGAKNSAGAKVQTLALLDYLAVANPSSAVLTSALEWTGEIVAANISAVAATWSVDVLQTATSSRAAIAMPAKLEFFYRIVDLVRPFKSALDLIDLAALKLVAAELGLEVPDDLNAGKAGDADPAAPYRHLEGQTVGLYSLTESATTRAAQILRSLLPGLDVRTNSEYVGSQRLAALSTNADIFVVVTASAKHAATDFIKAARAPKPLIQVNSRGTSAILHALAEG